ncbi:MAG TPA: hypothetical protein VNI57_04565, partial [Candidatus Saccharimonadales bacterium]|nr:hypothetical protein [Candidatus Saccharimonadales bacterium]
DGFDAARGEAERLAAAKPPAAVPQPVASSSPQPVPQPAKPKPVDDKVAIREVLRKYQQVFETEDLNLYQQIKPNVSGKELEGLKRVLDRVNHYDVAIEVSSIDVKGSDAVVTLLRQDTMDGKSRPRITQTLYMTKSATRGWVIERLGE